MSCGRQCVAIELIKLTPTIRCGISWILRSATLPTSDLLGQAFQIAVACDRSFYDSLYIALAVDTKTELITADERMVNALGSRFSVRRLGSFEANESW